MKKLPKSAIFTILSILLFIGWVVWFFAFRNHESTDDAYIKADTTLLAPKVTGYVVEIAVRDNQLVQKGDVLFRIDPKEYQARVHEAEAQVALQRAKKDSLDHQKSLQTALIQQAEASITASAATLDKGNKELQRAKSLIKQGAVSQQYLDSAAAEQENAAAMVIRNQAALEAAKRQMSIYDAGVLELDATLKGMEAALELAKIDLDNTVIVAPQDGIVANRSVQIGQLTRPGMVMAYLIPQKVWVEANFKETQLSQMRPGQRTTIEVDGYPGRSFTGKVDSISPAAGSEFSLLPPENATGNFTKIVRRVPVKIIFDNAEDEKLFRPGMSTEVTVLTQ